MNLVFEWWGGGGGYGIGELVVDVALHTYIAVGCGGVGVCEGMRC